MTSADQKLANTRCISWITDLADQCIRLTILARYSSVPALKALLYVAISREKIVLALVFGKQGSCDGFMIIRKKQCEFTLHFARPGHLHAP